MLNRNLALPRPFWVLSLFLALTPIIGCKHQPLDAAGKVSAWIPRDDGELVAAADSFPALTLSFADRSTSWLTQLREGKEAPDFIMTEWNRDLRTAAEEGLILSLKPYRDHLKARGSFPGWATDSSTEPAALFVPGAAIPWGLVYNRKLLDDLGLAIPEDWKSFLDCLQRVKASDRVPIALGASFGWPAGAWISYLDMRLNGGAAHRKLLAGERRFDSPDMVKVLREIEGWRDLGFFTAGASDSNWTDALLDVTAGRAAFTLVSASAWPRVTNRDAVGFIAVPAGKGSKGPRGELLSVQGFAVAAAAAAPEAALAISLAYAHSGAGGMVKDQFRVPVFAVGKDTTEAGFKSTEAAIVSAADVPAPQFDRALPAQKAYEFNRIVTAFFATQNRASAQDLAKDLAAAIGSEQ